MGTWVLGLIPSAAKGLADWLAPRAPEGKRAGDGKRLPGPWTNVVLIVSVTLVSVLATRLYEIETKAKEQAAFEDAARAKAIDDHLRETPSLVLEMRSTDKEIKATLVEVKDEMRRQRDLISAVLIRLGGNPARVGHGGVERPDKGFLASLLYGPPPSLVAGASAEEVVP